MPFLDRERSTLSEFLPGLDEFLADHTLAELEQPRSPAMEVFRHCGGPGLLVPKEHQGAGISPIDAVRVQRAIGSRSPSLAIATTMHHFSMASLAVISEVSNGFEWMLMEGVARECKLLASGFAEGDPVRSILEPTMTVEVTEKGLLVSGVKRPCSLSRSMDLLTVSAVVPTEDGTGEQFAVVLIPADDPGVTITPFWNTFALAGAESEQVTVKNVLVPYRLIMRIGTPTGADLDAVQIAGFLWFELLMTASYLGAASALVERVLAKPGAPDLERIALVGELETAMAAVETVAYRLGLGERGDEALAESLFVRYAVQDAIARVVPRSVELLGGMNFIGSNDIGYLAASCNGLALHPPSRTKMAGRLLERLGGKPLTIA